MSNHTAPSIVIETSHTKAGFLKGAKVAFLTLLPASAETAVTQPLGDAQPGYMRHSVLLNGEQAVAKRDELTRDEYVQMEWDTTPEYLQVYLDTIEQIPNDASVWVKGNLPTELLATEESAGA